MKTIKTLRPSGLIAAVLLATFAAEFIGWKVCTAFGIRFDGVIIATATTGLVVAFVAWRYDGQD